MVREEDDGLETKESGTEGKRVRNGRRKQRIKEHLIQSLWREVLDGQLSFGEEECFEDNSTFKNRMRGLRRRKKERRHTLTCWQGRKER